MAVADPAASVHEPGRLPLLGQMLVERGIATQADIVAGLERQRERGRRLGECLVELGHIDRTALYRVLAERAGVEFVDLQTRTIDPHVATLLPEATARHFQAIAIDQHPDRIVVAMANPEDVLELDDLAVITGTTIEPALADPEQLRAAISRFYASGDIPGSIREAAHDFADADPLENIEELTDGSIIRLVDALLEQEVNERASDLHIEPLSDRIRMRIRVDGVLRELSDAPLSVLRALLTRIKVMSNLDIANTRVPQDGRFTASIHGHDVDVRVAVLPSSHGESVVLRLLDNSADVFALPALGFRPVELARYSSAFRAPQGAVLVSGPTGSGKTSTLYSTPAELNTPARSIVSVEDPIEYQLDGVKQIQINPQAGLTFPAALRSILRNDPNVIFVGEIRDGETAHIAGEASITGHLVFSTIHTTSAASALTCVVAQRLARRICVHCGVVDEHPDLELLRRFGWRDELFAGHAIRRAVGCDACHGTGYYGRFAIYEVMLVDDEIRTVILNGGSTGEIERLAVAGGMDTMRTAALKRVVDGQLTVDELQRVVA